jgi:hypothetical protein
MASQQFGPLISAGINEQIDFAKQEWDPGFRQIYHTRPTDDFYEYDQQWVMYGLPGKRIPGQGVASGSFFPGYQKAYLQQLYGMQDQIPQEFLEWDRYAFITKILPKAGGELARKHFLQMEYDAYNYLGIIGFSSATSIPGQSDGLSLFNSAHPNYPGATSTQSNVIPGNIDLGIGSLWDAVAMLRTQYRPDGVEPMHNTPETLLVHPQLEQVAEQCVRGAGERITSDDNDNTALRDYKIKVLQSPLWNFGGSSGLPTAWALFGRERYLKCLIGAQPQTRTDFDYKTLSYIYTCYGHWAVGASDWRGAVASNGQ